MNAQPTNGQGGEVMAPPNDASASKLAFGSKAPVHEGDAPVVRKRAKVPQQTIVLLVVLSVSAGAIYGMRKLGIRAGIAMGGEVVDYAPPDTERSKSYERILADLARIQNPLDVALGEFGKSPFMLQQATQSVTAEPTAAAANEPSAEQRAAADAQRKVEERRQHLKDGLAQLKLQSVMGGRKPLVRINGQTYTTGETVGEEFVVKQIQDRSVTLSADGQDFVLTLELIQGSKAPPMKMGKQPTGKATGK